MWPSTVESGLEWDIFGMCQPLVTNIPLWTCDVQDYISDRFRYHVFVFVTKLHHDLDKSRIETYIAQFKWKRIVWSMRVKYCSRRNSQRYELW